MARTASLIALAIALMIGLALIAWTRAAQAQDTDGWAALTDGSVVLFRHAIAPGGGDPPGFALGDCATQRNLSEEGRAQARQIGAAFRARGVTVGRVLTSQWCRARDTAELAFPGQAVEAPAFNSFFGDRSRGPAQTRAARAILDAWQGPGVLVVTTHQVNIAGLTGLSPASGEGIVLNRDGAGWRVAGRIVP
jgi:phosphohistidine phosphatase SixA